MWDTRCSSKQSPIFKIRHPKKLFREGGRAFFSFKENLFQIRPCSG
jgi:hypothetical protein